MNRVLVLIVISMTAAASAAQPTDMDGAKTPNGKVVVAFIETLFNQHKGEEAFEKYVSRDYLDHGYLAADAAAGAQGMNSAMSAAPPTSQAAESKQSDFERMSVGEARMVANSKIHFDLKKVLVQGDLVFVQAHGTNGQSANGDLMWVLYRVKDGKILEHWVTHNEITNNQVNKQW